MGLLGRLLGREPDADPRGADVAARLEALSQLDPKWSTEALRRRGRDVFFAGERAWIERDPSVREPFMAAQLRASQPDRIEGLARQHRGHQHARALVAAGGAGGVWGPGVRGAGGGLRVGGSAGVSTAPGGGGGALCGAGGGACAVTLVAL